MRLFSVLGVPVFISVWLLLIMAVMLVLGLGNLLAVAVLVIGLHEIGHALCARALGLPVQEVRFFPLGGVLRLNMPLEQAGWREAVVALFGPVVSLVFAMGAIALQDTVLKSDVLTPFITANLTICAFNLLPALPLDGGRAFRAMLMSVVGVVRATRACVWVSRGIAAGIMALFVYSLIRGAPQWMALPIGVFLFMGANQENANISGYFRALTSKTDAFERDRVARMRLVAVKKGSSVGEVLRALPHSQLSRIVVMDDDLRPLYEIEETDLVRRALDEGLDARLNGQDKLTGR